MQPQSPFYRAYAAAPAPSPYMYPPTYAQYAATAPPLAYPPYAAHTQFLPANSAAHLSLPLPAHLAQYQQPGPPPYLYPPAPAPPAQPPKTPESSERDAFYRKLHAFRDAIGEPIQRLPTLGFKELDLWVLYKEVVMRCGIDAVIAKKQWKEVAEALQLPSSCTDSGFRLRLHYKKYLEAFERKFFCPAPPSPAMPTPCSVAPPAPRVGKDPRSPAHPAKKVAGQLAGPLELASSSVTSIGSGTTVDGGTENESAATESGGGGSQRSDGGCETSSKGRRGNAAVKKKKRTVSEKEKEEPVCRERQDVEVETGKEDQGCKAATCESEEKNGVLLQANGNKLALLHGVAMGRVGKTSRRRLDFSVLESATLKRYARVHGVGEAGEGGVGKSKLAERVSAHFEELALCGGETATLLQFIQAVRRR